jgi:hypothetical protein
VILASRTAVVFAAFAAAVLPVACSGGGGDEGSESAATAGADTSAATDAERRIRLTLTEDGCAYEGPGGVPAEPFTADLENRSSAYGAFVVGELAEGSTIADLEADLEKEQQRWDETQELRGPPDYFTQAVRVGVAAGDVGLLPVDVEPGTYALACFNDDLPVWRAYVAGQLEVIE